ncbi:MAG: hypothetical protein COA84_00510 [Robiginitomaculum sp.]|nr:MAG: hypothetical protein COA84_00510 [Robiginitomaculum sp.]
MTVWVTLLRGINVGGHHRLPMQDLRDILDDLGLKDTKTYIQSGNAVFLGPSGDPAALGQKITNAIALKMGFAPFVFLIEKDAFDQAITDNPFMGQIKEDKHMHVAFLTQKPTKPDLGRLHNLASNGEEFHLGNVCFYLHAPAGIGRSKLAAKVDVALGVKTTARNWRSLMAIKALADAL